MSSIILDVYMIDALENHRRLMRIAKKPEKPGTIMNVKETWATKDGVLYYKQYCDKNNIHTVRSWRYANQMPAEYVRYQLKVASCVEMVEAEFYAKYGPCLRYNNRLWNYEGMQDHNTEWFRERQWQNMAAATSDQMIYVITYELAKYRIPEMPFPK